MLDKLGEMETDESPNGEPEKNVRFNNTPDVNYPKHAPYTDHLISEKIQRSKSMTIISVSTLLSSTSISLQLSLSTRANMIGDVSRTGTYRKAIFGNSALAIKDKLVLDVGAGSGILSFMAAQAGAKLVLALEASSMADKISLVFSTER
jgi:predicted rRNA methylase YqxC with S4 and FtsJ domains